MLVGLTPCHGFSKVPGHTGGFYHLVCRHGVSVHSGVSLKAVIVVLHVIIDVELFSMRILFPLKAGIDVTAILDHFQYVLLQCTVASKFLTLTESVRDAVDLYTSLKYPPVVFICDSPCGFVRHLECQDPVYCDFLWGENSGCFERPEYAKRPSQVC